MKIEPGTQFHRSKDIIVSELDGASVFLNPETDAYFGANRVGTRIWEELEQTKSADGIIQTLRGEFDMSDSECETQVLEFLQQMVDGNLIEIV